MAEVILWFWVLLVGAAYALPQSGKGRFCPKFSGSR